MNKLSFLILTALIAVISFSCQQENKTNFTLKATITGAGDNMAYIQQRRNGDWVIYDSVKLVADAATFKGNVDLPEFYYLTLKDVQGYVPVFVDKGEITLTTNINNLRDVVITGSATQTEYEEFMKSLSFFDQKTMELSQAYQKASSEEDSVAMQQVENDYNALEKQKNQSMLEYAKSHNESVVSPFIIMSNSYLFNLEELEEVTNAFSEKIKDSYYVTNLKDRVATLKSVSVGQKFVDFTLNDTAGNPLALSSVVNGDYVLVDFWASWCMPCRAENPNVVEAYQKFHDKGFNVFGVSFDKDHAKWVDAIGKDGLVWPQVSDLKYWSCEAGKLYGVQSIPHNVLLGADGVIIAKDLRGKDLLDKLGELMPD